MKKILIIVTVMLLSNISLTSFATAQYYTSNRIGNTTFYNGPNGYSGNSQQIGNYNFYHDNRGNNCDTTRVGDYTYTNCH